LVVEEVQVFGGKERMCEADVRLHWSTLYDRELLAVHAHKHRFDSQRRAR
jgi:hypothetical protein